MPRYADGSKEAVREAVDMLDLVGTRTELKRAGGGRWTGRCPFHEERTPSFSVNEPDKLYHCFGCGVGGDPFTFVQESEGLDFVGSLEWLAKRYGIELEVQDESPQAAEARRRRERLLELLERASRFYVRHLWESAEAEPARAYLRERGLDEQVLREFRVGYAPAAGTLHEIAIQQGFSRQDVVAAGLARQRDGGLRDMFWRRITFTLADARGAVMGFGGRIMPGVEGPKYVNSPDGDLFHKGHHVYAADIARRPAAQAGEVVLVEGYTDVLALHQAGLRNTVAQMGTALTERQVAELAKLAPRVHLALDADSAGQAAMLKAAKVAAGRRLELRVVPLPAGQDPADLVAERGAEGARELVARSVPFVRFQVERTLAAEPLEDAEAKDRAIAALKPVFATLPASALREELLDVVAGGVGLARDLVASWLPQAGGGAVAPARPEPVARPSAPGPSAAAAARSGSGPEKAFLLVCRTLPGLATEVLRDLPDDTWTSEATREAAGLLREHPDDPAAHLGELSDAARQLVSGLLVRAGDLPPTSPDELRAQAAHLRFAQLDRLIAEARAAGTGGVVALRQEKESLRQAIGLGFETRLAATRDADA